MVAHVTSLVKDKKTTIENLRREVFGPTIEKKQEVKKAAAAEKESLNSDQPQEKSKDQSKNKPKKPGHGRNGVEKYSGANRIKVEHEALKHGDCCRKCASGKVYRQNEPKQLVRLVGQAPIGANVYELERFRCGTCGAIDTAKSPEGIGDEKYDAATASTLALLKYGSGTPMNRIETLQADMGIPLPASTQWEILDEAAIKAEPVANELCHQAAQGDVVYNDDTTMRVRSLKTKDNATEEPSDTKKTMRTGVFTSGIVSTTEGGNTIALYFTGRQHAGENLAAVLSARASGLESPIQMCDALSRNMPESLKTIVSNCLIHARREFVKAEPHFPAECEFVLECLGKVYQVDARAKGLKLSAKDRLLLHRQDSQVHMDQLKAWCEQKFANKEVEPNSRLGQAINYLTKHWERLTLFLRQPGAPLDNNLCERVLKKAILHRKNALFYETERGARVGDIFMSLIHTAEHAKINVFKYLTAIIKNFDIAKTNPSQWMPWNYEANLLQMTAARAVAEA